MTSVIPVILFAYDRPRHLKRILKHLRENNIPLLYVFSDGPKTSDAEANVWAVREILRQVDWCELHSVEREQNLGLGTSILSGVKEVFNTHEMLIVFEDDLVIVPGTYQYLCAALERYKDDPKAMSVTGWNHPLTMPKNIKGQPYFDGRAESWSWGTWKRAWKGMEQDAMSLVELCKLRNIDVNRYGADLLEMAENEKKQNIWAVRFSYLHIAQGGLCLRPPQSLVNHAGFEESGTNATGWSKWNLKKLAKRAVIPEVWPDVIENPECPRLWQRECGIQKDMGPLSWTGLLNKMREKFSHFKWMLENRLRGGM